jgi:hypothetical protein
MELVAAVYFLHTCRLLLKGKTINGSLLIFSVMHRKAPVSAYAPLPNGVQCVN